MPTTRSSSNAVASSSRLRLDADNDENGEATRANGEEDMDIEAHLFLAQAGVKGLRAELDQLRKKNRRLQAEIAELHERDDVSIAPRTRKSRGNNITVQAQIKALEGEVNRLMKARTKDKKTIKKLRMKEIREDAEELQDEQHNGVTDTSHVMKKLLRRFHDIVSSSVLDDAEECTICMEAMVLRECSSLACQHLFCNECISKILPLGSASVACPTCREQTVRDELEVVQYTAQQQWDDLLGVAAQFAKMDGRGEQDTSEEEAEEEEQERFIDDVDPDASSAAPEAYGTDAESETEQMGDAPSTPPAAIPSQSYSKSPSSTKRKRLEELAAQRRMKKK